MKLIDGKFTITDSILFQIFISIDLIKTMSPLDSGKKKGKSAKKGGKGAKKGKKLKK